eukprot:m.373860 g.373860  ORF g.373860 m.373860 type:complete len:1183 (+) comp20892_c0_seq1:204-3752(+)
MSVSNAHVIVVRQNDVAASQVFEEAFQFLQSSDLAVEAISENELMPFILANGRTCASKTFVLDMFKGRAFDALQTNNCRIIGAPLVHSNFCEDVSMLQMQHKIQYTNILKDQIILCANWQSVDAANDEALRQKLLHCEELIRWMGGKHERTLTERTTHVIANEVTAVVRAARVLRKPVLQLYWVQECWTKSWDSVFPLDTTYPGNVLPILAGCTIHLDPEMWHDGSKTRERVRLLGESIGARFVSSLDAQPTHYITDKVDDRAEWALANNVIVVRAKWIISCVLDTCWIDEAPFYVTRTTKTTASDALSATGAPDACATPDRSFIAKTADNALGDHTLASPPPMALLPPPAQFQDPLTSHPSPAKRMRMCVNASDMPPPAAGEATESPVVAKHGNRTTPPALLAAMCATSSVDNGVVAAPTHDTPPHTPQSTTAAPPRTPQSTAGAQARTPRSAVPPPRPPPPLRTPNPNTPVIRIHSDSVTPDSSAHEETVVAPASTAMTPRSGGRHASSMKRKRSQSSHVDVLPPTGETRAADCEHTAMDEGTAPPPSAAADSPPHTSPSQNRFDKYMHKVIEMVECEEQYQATLNTIIDLFYTRLVPYLDMMDMKELFANIFEIKHISDAILVAMKRSMDAFANSNDGDTPCSLSHIFDTAVITGAMPPSPKSPSAAAMVANRVGADGVPPSTPSASEDLMMDRAVEDSIELAAAAALTRTATPGDKTKPRVSRNAGKVVRECVAREFRLYVAGHKRARDKYDSIMHPTADRKYMVAQSKIRGLETDARCQRQILRDLLLMPVQHLMRYKLHFKDMRKSLPEDCTERAALDATIEFINSCVVSVNETQADFESTTALLSHLKQFNAEVCFKLGREFIESIKGKKISENAGSSQHSTHHQRHHRGTVTDSGTGEPKSIKAMLHLMNDSIIVVERNDSGRNKIKDTITARMGRQASTIVKYSNPQLFELQDVQLLCDQHDDTAPAMKLASSKDPENVFFRFVPRRPSDTQHFLELCRNTRKARLDEMSQGMAHKDKVENGFVPTADEESDAENKVLFDLDPKSYSDAGDPYGMIPIDKENMDDSIMDTSMNTSTSTSRRSSIYSFAKKSLVRVTSKLWKTPSRQHLGIDMAGSGERGNITRSASMQSLKNAGSEGADPKHFTFASPAPMRRAVSRDAAGVWTRQASLKSIQ